MLVDGQADEGPLGACWGKLGPGGVWLLWSGVAGEDPIEHYVDSVPGEGVGRGLCRVLLAAGSHS